MNFLSNRAFRMWFGKIGNALFDRAENRLYQSCVHQEYTTTLYRAEAQVAAWLFRQPWLQRYYRGRETRVIRRFLSEITFGQSESRPNEKQIIQQAFVGDYLRRRWKSRLMAAAPDQLATLITVDGKAIFTSAYAQGKGVILVSYHTYAAHLVETWLSHTGIQPQVTIRVSIYAARQRGLAHTAATEPFIYARQIYEAHECLQQGGIVYLLPDGAMGGKGIDLPIYQRTHSFRTSFAELALRSGAAIMPVSALLARDGKVAITFHQPFQPSAQNQPGTEQCEALVKQYVAFLHKAWRKAPGSVTINLMKMYLNCPLTVAQKE